MTENKTEPVVSIEPPLTQPPADTGGSAVAIGSVIFGVAGFIVPFFGVIALAFAISTLASSKSNRASRVWAWGGVCMGAFIVILAFAIRGIIRAKL